ncbi:MAG: carboxypeptidase-like regulatory domain-containing protein [Gemmatimonadota bacterium]
MRQTRVLFAIGMLCLNGSVAAQQVTVEGRVVEAGTRTGIRGAEISIAGVGRVITRENGGFRVGRVQRGPTTVMAAAFGYQTRELQLDVQSDTALLIELEPQALQLNPVVVSARTVTVRGQVFAVEGGAPISDAGVSIGRGSSNTNLAGNFKIGRVPAGTPVLVHVGAVTFMPVSLSINADRDTTLRVGLTPDPIGQALLKEAVRQIEVRSRAVPFSRDQWTREQLSYFPRSVDDLLTQRYGRRQQPACVFLNDNDVSVGGKELLESFYTDDLERVEVFNRGTMVRLYTRRYAARQTTGAVLQPIVLVLGRGRPMCR